MLHGEEGGCHSRRDAKLGIDVLDVVEDGGRGDGEGATTWRLECPRATSRSTSILPAQKGRDPLAAVSPQRSAVGTAVVESGGSLPAGVRQRAADWAGVGHSGPVKLTGKSLARVRLRREHPRARDACKGFRPLVLTHHMEELVL